MNEVKNFTINGACSNCGECCCDILPLTAEDVFRLKKYVAAHHIEPLHRKFPLPNGTVDLGCPFRDEAKRICTVYPARPWICRAFRCDQSKQEIEQRKAASVRTTKTFSLRFVIFGDDRNLAIQEITQRYIFASGRGHRE